ncbi:MAG: DUF4153 domain-containing protein [Fimbriimonadaceae bacterium]
MVSHLAPKSLLFFAIIFGLVAGTLFYQADLGMNVALIGSLLTIAILILNRKSQFKLTKLSLALLMTAGFFALMFGFHDAAGLKIANFGALVIALGGSLYLARDAEKAKASLPALIFQPIANLCQTLPWAYQLGNITHSNRSKNSNHSKTTSSIIVGATVATPLLFVFGGLFYSADAMFKSHVDSVASLQFDLSHPINFLTIAAPITIFVAGIFHHYFIQADDKKPPIVNEFIGPQQFPSSILFKPTFNLGNIEITVILGSLVTLFATFIATQFQSLFGGTKTIATTTGLTAAEYARSGFFQLVWVAALALITILWLDKIQNSLTKTNKWLIRSLITLVFFVIGSAALRMAVYTSTFGLTELRLYTSVFMVWIAIAFAWLIPTVTTNNPKKFGFGALTAGFAVIAIMNFANPEAIITRTNLAMKSPDLQYIATLSADARVEWQNNPSVTSETRKVLIDRTYSKQKNSDWRSANLSQFLTKKY